MHRTAVAAVASRVPPHRPSLLMLGEKDVRRCLDLRDCLDVNRRALVALADRTAQVPTRLGIPYYRLTPSSPQRDDSSCNHQEPETDSPPSHEHSHHHRHDHHCHHHRHHHHHHHYTASSTAAAAETSSPDNNNYAAAAAPADDWTLFKPAAYRDSVLGMKLVSIRSDNPLDGLPLVPATILTVDAKTGIVDAVVAGTYLTAARTAAGSALATAHALGRPGRTRTLEHLVVFGAGLQAELHVQAIATALTPTAHEEEEGPSSSSSSSSLSAIPIRKIPKLTLVNRNLDRARQLAGQLVDWCGDIQVVELSDDLGVADALSTANVIVTATNTVTPLFSHSSGLIPSGCHINGIGSYTPSMQEVPCRFVSDRCTVWVDTNEARQVGDLQALSPNHPCHLFGRVLLEQEQEPSWPHLDCTFYKAVGTAIQDVMTADLVVRRARELNLGTAIDMS